MPRTISGTALAKVTAQYGSEPIVILEIEWISGGQRHRYADRDIPADSVKGRILELSGMDAVIQVSNGGDSQEISVTLDDTDGEIKGIMDSQDIHKRTCWVYQWFEGIPYADKFLLFRGQINSHPLTWNEGDRTVSFDITNTIENVEIGFSIEEGNFNDPPADLIGKPWPLCFGTVVNVPALKIKALQQGTLQQGVGIKDPTLDARLGVANNLVCPINFEKYKILYYQNPPFKVTPFFSRDPNCERRKCEIIEGLELQISEQNAFQFSTFTVYGGENFPQNQPITLDINGGKFFGRMNGNVFTCTGRRHPDVASNGDIDLGDEKTEIKSQCGDAHGFQVGKFDMNILNRFFTDALESINNVDQLAKAPEMVRALTLLAVGVTPQAPTPEEVTSTAVASQVSFDFFNALPTLNFFWANAGSKVTLDSNRETIYVANILPSTVIRVAAYRQLSGGRMLVTVPASFYTIRTVDYGGYDVVEIVFDRPLSSRQDQGWDDDIYVTLTSTIGPNTVDILEWIITTYTDFTTDTTSFAAVKTKLTPYPSHFAILDRPNVVDILQDIAFQARCALWLRDDKFFIKYLAEEPSSDESIGIGDIEEKSLELFHTETEDIVTKYVAEWRKDYAATEPNKLILRHNVQKYGTHEETKDFFIYNILELVRKSATFWLIRKSNTWRKLKLRTHFNKLKLETFDTATVTHTAAADVPIKCLVEKASFDSATRRMEFELWTPVLSGTRNPYNFAWPAGVSEKLLWPTIEERLAGNAGSGQEPNFSVIAPAGHPLANPTAQQLSLQCPNGQTIPAGASISKFCRGDHGDNRPSDVGDVAPVPETFIGGGDINTGTDPVTSRTQTDCCALAQQALEEAKRALQEASRKDEPVENNDQENLPEECGGNCTARVKLKYGIPSMIHNQPGEIPYFDSMQGAQGQIVAITDTREECHTFNSIDFAREFEAGKSAQIQAKTDNYGFTVGTEELYQATLVDPNLGTDNSEFNPDGSSNPNFGQPCVNPPDNSGWFQTGYTSTPAG